MLMGGHEMLTGIVKMILNKVCERKVEAAVAAASAAAAAVAVAVAVAAAALILIAAVLVGYYYILSNIAFHYLVWYRNVK